MPSCGTVASRLLYTAQYSTAMGRERMHTYCTALACGHVPGKASQPVRAASGVPEKLRKEEAAAKQQSA